MTLGELIQTRRRELGLTLQQVATMAGCGKSYLSQIENGRRPNPPGEDLLLRLERTLRLDRGRLRALADWASTPASVRREFEELQRERETTRRLASLLRERGVDALHRSGELRTLVGRIAQDDAEPEFIGIPRQAPLINKVAAGYPTEFTDLGYPARIADEYVSVPELSDPDAFAARVVGDSMTPEYREGDVVVFSPERAAWSGADCFVRFERDAQTTFKRVYFERGERGEELIRLQPLNSAYPPRVVRREEVAGLYAAVSVVRPVRANGAIPAPARAV